MTKSEFITHLLAADEEGRLALCRQHPDLVDLPLAWALKATYDDYESKDPALAATVAATLTTLTQVTTEPQVLALATWTSGIAAIYASQLETAHTRLTLAREQFLACQQPLHAAATQISHFRVLAMLGRDEEALHWGEWARSYFEAAGDQLATGKIEQNLAGLHFFRDRYTESEKFLRKARTRFETVDDQKELIFVENNLATMLTAQYKFGEAAVIYQQALTRAETGHFEVTMAQLECNLGCLALSQGHFDQALDYLERSRRRYLALKMPHESAIADQEIADAYLELNLAPEAAAIYTQVIPLFAELGMRAEQARALAYHGRAALLLNQLDLARALLAEANALYQTLGNEVGAAMVRLYQAYAAFLAADFTTATTTAQQTEAAFVAVNAWGRLLQARWLRGEALRQQGKRRAARLLLEETLRDAQQQMVPQIAHRCFTSLGQVAMADGDVSQAEAYFRSALALIEHMRAPLPAEAFRIAFLSDKLTPYTELIRLCLADGSPQRVAEALGYVERARARALLDLLGDVQPASPAPPDTFTAEVNARIATLREELNWFYSQINRPDSPTATRGPAALADLQVQVQEREATMLDLMHRLQQRSDGWQGNATNFDLAQLQSHLGTDTMLVEYFTLDGALLAFVVTDQMLTVVDLHCREEDVQNAVQQFHFQLGALRYARERMARHQATLTARANHHLALLYDHLLRPLASYWGERRLLVAPHRVLNYVPFHALYDGTHYVVEERELCYTPSATIFQHCLATPKRPWQQALLLGVPDEAAPRIQDEIATLAPLFPAGQVLLNGAATRAALLAQAPTADLLHLACHGRFRADNPLFSALQLSDGWFTVHDAAQLKLRCNLVTLSACETGVNTSAPGDELLGLVRGFLLAGAPTLLVSLWTVDDAATAEMMTLFYTRLLAGDSAAAALRHAQRQLLQQHPHPFLWAPFILYGHWL
jgi:CHAT domain-containing protein/tetratricopeptide (TPR) repeat protein